MLVVSAEALPNGRPASFSKIKEPISLGMKIGVEAVVRRPEAISLSLKLCPMYPYVHLHISAD
jgi:hypothetical protein